jgi:hypothetical protein
MTRASWITLLATVVLSNFAVAAQQGGKVWWPQFRGPNSSGLGEGRPPAVARQGRKAVSLPKSSGCLAMSGPRDCLVAEGDRRVRHTTLAFA